MMTNTGADIAKAYDPYQYPAFAVTVDVVIFTMVAGELHVLLVQRAQKPFAGMWAIPGGFKFPSETLDQAAARELVEETGVSAAALLQQFGAYGDPGRDPRMNVVTVAYLAVVPKIGEIVAGTDAAHASLVPVAKVLHNSFALAFDHKKIIKDALERVRVQLEISGVAAAFVGQSFTLSELRAVYEQLWNVELDSANFRRSVSKEEGWLIATGQLAAPGPDGGKPAELFRAGKAWISSAPIRRPRKQLGKR